MHTAYIIIALIVYLVLLGWFIASLCNSMDLDEADLYNGKSIDDVGV